MDRFRSKIIQNYPKIHWLVTFVAIAGEVVGGEEGEEVVRAHVMGEQVGAIRGEGLGTEGAEDAGTAAVLGRGDPLEIGGTVVGGNTIEVINGVLGRRLSAEPGECDEHMTESATSAYFEVVLPASAVSARGIKSAPRFDLVKVEVVCAALFVLAASVGEELTGARAVERSETCQAQGA